MPASSTKDNPPFTGSGFPISNNFLRMIQFGPKKGLNDRVLKEPLKLAFLSILAQLAILGLCWVLTLFMGFGQFCTPALVFHKIHFS